MNDAANTNSCHFSVQMTTIAAHAHPLIIVLDTLLIFKVQDILYYSHFKDRDLILMGFTDLPIIKIGNHCHYQNRKPIKKNSFTGRIA